MTTSETLPQGVTVPRGFSAASTTAGIKPSDNPDMALVVNQGPRFDAAAVFTRNRVVAAPVKVTEAALKDGNPNELKDRKSTRLNSSHVAISYAVFCLKKKKDNSQ